MGNKTMKDGERASFEAWASLYTNFPEEYDNIPAWLAWEARAASPQSVEKGEAIPDDCDVRKILLCVVPGDGSGHEVYAKNIGDVEQLLIELGERLEEFESARAAAPQAALSGHVIGEAFLKWSEWTTELGEAISRKNIDGFLGEARSLLTQAPTERMSDAAREGYRDYQDGMERENNPFLEPHSVGFQEWEKGWNAARKAEIEHGEGQS